MKLLLTVALTLALVGCTTASYYAPESSGNTYRGGNACSTTAAYQATLDGTVRLFVEATPRREGVGITIAFHVPRGQTIQLLSPAFGAQSELPNESMHMTASVITSGSRGLRIPITQNSPTDLLTAEGRYEHLAAPYGPDDIFIVELERRGTPPPRFELHFPSTRINGRVVNPPPVSLILRSESRSMCVQ